VITKDVIFILFPFIFSNFKLYPTRCRTKVNSKSQQKLVATS